MKNIEIISENNKTTLNPKGGHYEIGNPLEVSISLNPSYRRFKISYETENDLKKAQEELGRFAHDYALLQESSELATWACELPLEVKISTECKRIK